MMLGKLAIRVRPFSARQKETGEHLCMQIKGGRARIFDAEDPDNRYRQFDCDYPFWSHDQFTVTEDGYFAPKNHIFADQQIIYKSLGEDMLEDAWQGYNCCLFAYGQSGAGKTYTMFGTQQNEGIIPRFCRELFRRIEESKSENNKFVVAVSMTDIYLEKLSDLLRKERAREGLKIREHKVLGIYVEDLSEVIVRSSEQLEGTIQLGIRNQQINNTYMGRCSNRAHTVVKITLRQTQQREEGRHSIVSVINFADLAGSERVGRNGASYDRLKQVAMIGKGLSCLGNVISTLADISQGIRRSHVPYRDSCLTRMMTYQLGGNCKTTVLLALSPAMSNYDESLSTLRFGDRSSKVTRNVTKNVKNQNKQEQVIAEVEKIEKRIEERTSLLKKETQQQQTKQN